MRIITVTVTGPDRSGIIAKVTTCLFEAKANVLSLDEKVVSGVFSMTLNADATNVNLDTLKKSLKKVGAELEQDIRVMLRESKQKKHLAILVTKEPKPLLELIKQCKSGKILAKPVVVIGNHPDLSPIAKKAGIPFYSVTGEVKADRERKVISLLKQYDADFVALARHMQILSPEFVARYEGRIINIHPSLLPAFPGARPYHQAVEAGVTVVGVTAHFVTTDLDRGPVIEQGAFKVKKTDSVESITERGQKLEATVLAKACELYSRDKLYLHWGKVYMK